MGLKPAAKTEIFTVHYNTLSKSLFILLTCTCTCWSENILWTGSNTKFLAL